MISDGLAVVQTKVRLKDAQNHVLDSREREGGLVKVQRTRYLRRRLILQPTPILRLMIVMLLLIHPKRMLRLLQQPLLMPLSVPMPIRLTMAPILILMDIPLPTTSRMEVLIPVRCPCRRLRHDIRRRRRCRSDSWTPCARGGNHVAGAAAAGGVLGSVGLAGDAFADNVGVDVLVRVGADVAGA